MARVILPFRMDVTGADQNIYTYEGWRAHVNAPALEKPELLSREAYAALGEEEREAYDELRRMYIMRFGPINTPALAAVKKCIKEQLEANIRAGRDQVKVGLVIDGHANLGKTTIAKAVGRQFERTIRAKAVFPDRASADEFVPVVHVTLQRDTTPKGMALAICEYLHVPLRGRETESQLVNAIYDAVERHSILLFVVDDIHFLQTRSRAGTETSNFLKSLMSRTGATFMYIGVDVESMGFLQERGGPTLATSQTASRLIHLPVRPMEKGSHDWKLLLRALESHLLLLDHTPGTLERHEALLHNRSGGSMGSLMNLLRRTAMQAVGGRECIQREDLVSAPMDYRSTMEGSLEADAG